MDEGKYTNLKIWIYRQGQTKQKVVLRGPARSGIEKRAWDTDIKLSPPLFWEVMVKKSMNTELDVERIESSKQKEDYD